MFCEISREFNTYKTLKKLSGSDLWPVRSDQNGSRMQIRSLEVTHDFITILSLILHPCLNDPNWNRASRSSGLLARLTTQNKNEYGSLVDNTR